MTIGRRKFVHSSGCGLQTLKYTVVGAGGRNLVLWWLVVAPVGRRI